MKIASIEAVPLRLPFREEFRISRGSVGSPDTGAPHIFVRVRAEDGTEGWGEARPSHRWSYETEESVVAAIRVYLAPALVGHDAWDLRGLHAVMNREIAPGLSTGCPVAKCGIDMAVHDLLGKLAGVPLYSLLGGSAAPVPLTYLISVATAEEAARRAGAAWEAGYRGFKVKIGVHPEKDREILRAVREAAPDAYLWADANQAYEVAAAVALARAIEPLGVGCLEQPVPANDWTGLRQLAARTSIPIGVDESVFAPSDLLQLIKLEACGILVLKLSKMAGIYPAMLGARIAKEAGVGLLGSGLTESRLGLAASAHLIAACGGCPGADLNGPQFLADDPVASGVEIERGQIVLSSSPGIGVELDQGKLRGFLA